MSYKNNTSTYVSFNDKIPNIVTGSTKSSLMLQRFERRYKEEKNMKTLFIYK